MFQVFLMLPIQHTRVDGFVPGIGHILCAPQEYPLPPQRTGHVNQLYPQLRDPPRYFLWICNPKLVCYTALLIAHASCSPLIDHEQQLHLPVRRLYGPTFRARASAATRLQRVNIHTRSDSEALLLCSCRAKFRRRSYSASALLLWLWLKAIDQVRLLRWYVCEKERRSARTTSAQLGHGVWHDAVKNLASHDLVFSPKIQIQGSLQTQTDRTRIDITKKLRFELHGWRQTGWRCSLYSLGWSASFEVGL